ncbi:formate dehydrogenase accessory sulfurtransferase FdhD [Colwellia demingiae]|uniref:Sulfur carrier protein FdhD n=1 Tax=Colwellia demingiae TaxID=89401 RepID=A0A5C6Q3W7_9GAMM|nr:formate dehydrogenase accessory sulfurtransferase FdhD [Colwellia demingiae]
MDPQKLNQSQDITQYLGIKKITRKIRKDDGLNIPKDNDWVIEEEAIALIYNGISHAVMMATPCDLLDFAIGFSLSENIIRQPSDIVDHKIIHTEQGVEIELSISSRQFSALKHKRRSLLGNSGCGLCGVESLAQTIKARKKLPLTEIIDFQVVRHALAQFRQQQILNQKTGSVHAAAYCSKRTGNIMAIREDVGRHNALDKLLGSLAKQKEQLTNHKDKQGFILVSSRASYEMVDKTLAAGIDHLVSISAATSKAITWAQQHHLHLIGFASRQRHITYTNY